MKKGSSNSLLDYQEPNSSGMRPSKGFGDTTSGLGTVNSKGTKDGAFFVSRVDILTKDKEIRKDLYQIE